MKKKNMKLRSNKGITGIDLAIAIIVLATFTGVIITLMSNIYRNSIDIQKNANAMAYATIVLEKVDEKAFEEINADFVNTLKDSGEVEISSDYIINFSTEVLEENLIKKVGVKVSYDINGEQRTITINKLKIKEIYKEWTIII